MKFHSLNLIALFTLGLSTSVVFAQKPIAIKDSVLLDIPNIGRLGGAHLLNWTLNTDKSEIFVYAYSHVQGSEMVSSVAEIEAAKNEHADKSFFGKMLSASGASSENVIVPVVLEGRILANDMSVINTKKYLFHKFDALPEGKSVFFKPTDNIVDITGFEPGTVLDYHYNDLNKAFKYAPKLDQELLSLTELKVKGEGFLGTKNMAPWLTNKKAYFKYVDNKGYISDVETIDLINLKDSPELEDYEFLRESDNAVGENYIAWFSKKKDDAAYKMVSYNEETNKMQIQNFEFDTPRKPKAATQMVYNTELKAVGFVTIFGYHKKGKKSETYQNTDFDIVYTDLTGAIKFQTKFSHGTDKDYKNVVSPLLIIDQGNDLLKFVNNHQISLIKSQFEIFTLNATGTLTVEQSEAFATKQGEARINYYDYLVDFDVINKMGSHYIIRKKITKTASESIPNSSLQKQVTLNSGYNYTVLDSNFMPVRFGSFDAGSDLKEGFSFQTIEMTDAKLTSLATREGNYYLTTITPDHIKTVALKTDLGQNASRMLYFGSYMKDFALVDKEAKEFFILHQYYTKDKVLDKVAVLKVGY